MLSYRTFFLALAIVAGVMGLVGTVGIAAFICESLAVVFFAIVGLLIFLEKKS